jgi:hypothetical protein
MYRKIKESKIDHHASKEVKENICNVITHGVEFPDPVINGITEHPDGLVSIPWLNPEYFLDSFPT